MKRKKKSLKRKVAKKLIEWGTVSALTLIFLDPKLVRDFIAAGWYTGVAFVFGLFFGLAISPFGDPGLGPEGESFMEDFELL